MLEQPRPQAISNDRPAVQDGCVDRVHQKFGTHPRIDPIHAIALAAEDLQLWQEMRIATENRVRSLEQANREVPQSRLSTLEEIKLGEDRARKRLEQAVQDSPWQTFVDQVWGVGAKSLGIFLGAVGNPAWHYAEDRPRLVSELMAYCGHGDPERRRKYGMSREEASQAGKPAAKVAARLCVAPQVNFIMKSSPYRSVYDAAKLDAAERHPDWTPGHINNHGLRLATKQFLKDIWAFGRAVIAEQGPPSPRVYKLRSDDVECPYWGLYARCTRKAAHQDHKIPVSRGGTDDKENIQLICGACNTYKNNRTDEEFRELLQRASDTQEPLEVGSRRQGETGPVMYRYPHKRQPVSPFFKEVSCQNR